MTPSFESFWDHQILAPTPTTHRLSAGGTPLLFDEQSQHVFALNETSAALWSALCLKGTLAEAVAFLAGGDLKPHAILAFARSAVREWFQRGYIRPAQLGRAPTRTLRLGWMGCVMALEVSGEIDAAPLNSIFAPFVTADAPRHILHIEALGDWVFISDDHGACCARSTDGWIPEVKARFTSGLLAEVQTGFLLHAALLARHGRGLLICGDPGAGKTTLSVSLLLSGFDYRADDIVWMGEDGRVVGAPFAPALKTGTWPLLDEMDGDFPTSATYLRSDGQSVRYLLAPSAQRGPVELGWILLMARRPGPEPARIEPAEPLQILTSVLNSAYSARAKLSAAALAALIRSIEDSRTGVLHFNTWQEGRHLIDQFAP